MLAQPPVRLQSVHNSGNTQQPAEVLAAAYSASGFFLANLFRREEEDITFPLVVSFGVIMIDELS